MHMHYHRLPLLKKEGKQKQHGFPSRPDYKTDALAFCPSSCGGWSTLLDVGDEQFLRTHVVDDAYLLRIGSLQRVVVHILEC